MPLPDNGWWGTLTTPVAGANSSADAGTEIDERAARADDIQMCVQGQARGQQQSDFVNTRRWKGRLPPGRPAQHDGLFVKLATELVCPFPTAPPKLATFDALEYY